MKKGRLLPLIEISQAEFCEHIEDDDFFLAYGNPVVIRCDSGGKIVAIAWPLAERIMRASGHGDEADEVLRKVTEMAEEKNER